MKEQIKAPEKNTTKRWKDSQPIRCTVQNTGNQDTQLKSELVGYGHKIDEKLKAMVSEIKENVQGTNSDGKETGTRVNGPEGRMKLSTRTE